MSLEKKPKISTMSELSKAIGVSRPTLSRFFQDPATVRPTTGRKIKERLETVDYVYNFIATRQNRKSSGLVGIIIPHYKDLFFASMLEAIEQFAGAAGYSVITQSSNGSSAGEIEAVRRLRSMGVDGAVVAPLGASASTEAFAAARQDFPIVFVDSRPDVEVPSCDFVGTDNHSSIASMVEFLCRTGPPPIYLGMPDLNSNSRERERAYVRQMEQLNFEPRTVASGPIEGSWDFEAYGYTIMNRHFGEQRHLRDTLMCANDRVAIGAIRAANRHGLFAAGAEHGGGLRIAGHDDHPLSGYMSPAITTFSQDVAGIAETAVDLLRNRIGSDADGPAVSVFKPGRLQVREST